MLGYGALGSAGWSANVYAHLREIGTTLELVLEGAAELEKDLREKVTGVFFAVVLPPDGVA